MHPSHSPEQGLRPNPGIRTVLLDLDGTLLDTAPDMAFALNRVLEENGGRSLPFTRIRPVVSHGAKALIRLGFGLEPEDPAFEPLRRRFLDIYRENLDRETRPFPGMPELLDALESRDLAWGVVTNKPSWLTEPLLERLDLRQRAACVVSGDTTPVRKPDPAPLLHACEAAGSMPQECLYVGDARRDIEAGRHAGMRTLVALFGYIGADERPESWGADGHVAHPREILGWIDGHG